MTTNIESLLDHLLATALVGTARQPWPPVDGATIPAAGSTSGIPAEPPPDTIERTAGPETALLDDASRRRVLRLLAEPPRDSIGAAGSAPGDEDDCPPAEGQQASPAAAEVLAAALARRDIWSVEVWMDAAVRHTVTVPPVLWTPLAELLVTGRRVPRRVLGAALGPQGRWFLCHHPAWRALVTPWPPSDTDSRVAGDPPGAEDARTALQVVLTGPGPWPPAVVDTALAEALSGRFRGTEGRRLGVLLARRLPLHAYGRLVAAARALTARALEAGEPEPAVEVWRVIEEVLDRRREIEECFDPSAATEREGPSWIAVGGSSSEEEP